MTMRPGDHPDELLSAALTGDLTDAERATLDAHLAGCERCRETRAAFTSTRKLVSGLRQVGPPRDLAARVSAGIEGGRFEPRAWWRRPSGLVAIGASLATVAAAVLAVVLLSDLPNILVGEASPSPTPELTASISSEATASLEPSVVPSVAPPDPTPTPDTFLQPGEVGWLRMTGGPFQALDLAFVKEVGGPAVQTSSPSGPPIASALSPDGAWLAYITEVGETGFNQVWVLNLADGMTRSIGCSMALPFTERLAWSETGTWLAYTLAAVDPGATINCGAVAPAASGTDVWVFRPDSGQHERLTESGDAYAADFSFTDLEGGSSLLVSHAASDPWTESHRLPMNLDGTSQPADRLDGIFLPSLAPNGTDALYWRGTMAQAEDGSWRFAQGGLPYVGPFGERPLPDGTPLFTDLDAAGGDGFEHGQFAWGATGDLIAFWAGRWTGAPRDAESGYPNVLEAYVGSPATGLSAATALGVSAPELGRIVDVALAPDGTAAIVTMGLTSAGIGDPPSSVLVSYPLDGGEPTPYGGAPDSPPWDGPAVFGTWGTDTGQ